jgi:uncharacterized protein (TIGR02145 family)
MKEETSFSSLKNNQFTIMNSKTIFLLILTCILFFGNCKKIDKEILVSTGEMTNVLQNSAVATGDIIDLGNGATQYGHCWATTPNPTTINSKTMLGTPSGLGGYISQLLNLDAGSKYYIKAYLNEGTKTVYGKETSFITGAATLPTVTTAAISSVTGTTASGGGNVTSEGGAPTERGVCWSSTTNPTIANSKIITDGTGTGIFISYITNLLGGITYYARAFATNVAGTAYGNEVNFTTSLTVPVITTLTVSSITPTTATCGGNITHSGGAPVTARGICWSTSASPTTANSVISDGSGIGSFVSNMSSLTAGTIYYVRAYATNSIGTTYGNELSFATIVNDADGNVYHVVAIGTQVWMVENLKTTKFNDNTPIPLVTDFGTWGGLSTPGYCWYNNDATSYKAIYGAIYNWYALDASSTGGKNVCPAGWHAPNDAEWTTLTAYLGGETIAGGKLKESGITHWLSPNSNATNQTGFTALPGGSRVYDGSFTGIGSNGGYWSTTNFSSSSASYFYLDYRYSTIVKYGFDMSYGFSVRCLKDY